jgi:hypothetical protein
MHIEEYIIYRTNESCCPEGITTVLQPGILLNGWAEKNKKGGNHMKKMIFIVFIFMVVWVHGHPQHHYRLQLEKKAVFGGDEPVLIFITWKN